MLLTACVTAPSEPVALPTLYQYAPEVQAKAAEELGEAIRAPCPRETVIDGCSATARLVYDYFLLREGIRAAGSE